MRHLTLAALAASAVLIAGCVDLNVANPNAPTRDQVLSTAGDVESLVVGAYRGWYSGVHHWVPTYWLRNASFQSASTAALAANIDHSPIPRNPIFNEPNFVDYRVVNQVWDRTYRSLTAVADGLAVLDEEPALLRRLDDEDQNGGTRVRAFGKMVQALGHATLAVYYDQAVIRDETTDLNGELPLAPYPEVMAAAYDYFDEAIALAESADFTLPAGWMSVEVTSDQLVRLLHSHRAIFRAAMPRWRNEPVDWAAVVADLDASLTTTFVMDADPFGGWYNGSFDLAGGPRGWAQESYFIIGMADQSGNYQRWLDMPIAERRPWFDGVRYYDETEDPFLIVTPDTRFPRGATLAEQEADPGEYYVIPRIETWGYDVAEHFINPGRGTWRWSYYYYPTSWEYWNYLDYDVPLITTAELDLLRAEALFETGDAAGAAALVNDYRTLHGLAATDITGTNTDCVPRLPDGTCGGLMEMLKWEKRLEVESVGLFNVGWYWDGRRWGDHYLGTPLQLPIPAAQLEVMQVDVYTFGGVGTIPPSGSPGSTYDWPGEG